MIMIETPERSVTAQDVARAVRNCTECVYKRPDGCSAWECSFISRPEAVEAYRRTRWIPVEERLPEQRQSVLISTNAASGKWTGEGCYWETTENHVIWKGYRWNATYWDDEVVAWMPLPEPYEEGAK